MATAFSAVQSLFMCHFLSSSRWQEHGDDVRRDACRFRPRRGTCRNEGVRKDPRLTTITSPANIGNLSLMSRFSPLSTFWGGRFRPCKREKRVVVSTWDRFFFFELLVLSHVVCGSRGSVLVGMQCVRGLTFANGLRLLHHALHDMTSIGQTPKNPIWLFLRNQSPECGCSLCVNPTSFLCFRSICCKLVNRKVCFKAPQFSLVSLVRGLNARSSSL